MKKKSLNKKLVFKKESIAELNNLEKEVVKGGVYANQNTWGAPCKYMCAKDPEWSKRAKTQLV